MELKKAVTYRVPFHSEGVTWCGILLALSVFIRCVYYFAPCDFSRWNAVHWIFAIVLPMLLCGGFAVLLKLVHLRSPGVYGILAATICLALLIGDVAEGKMILIIISLLIMPLLGFLLLATYGGYIPFRSISSFALILACVFRLFFWGVCGVSWGVIISDLSILMGLFCFTVSLRPCED